MEKNLYLVTLTRVEDNLSFKFVSFERYVVFARNSEIAKRKVLQRNYRPNKLPVRYYTECVKASDDFTAIADYDIYVAKRMGMALMNGFKYAFVNRETGHCEFSYR